MKKTFPHKIAAMKTPDGLSSHTTLASTLKAIVSSELKIDKKQLEDTEKTLSQTVSTSKLSIATKGSKGQPNGSSNSSLMRNDESLKVLRKIVKQEISKEKPFPSRIKNLGREEFRDVMLDSIQHLKKQVADLRSQMYQSTSTDYRTNCSISKPIGSCSSIEETWTEVCLANSSSQIINPARNIKSSLEKRLILLEDSIADDRESLRKQFDSKLMELELQNQSYLKELNQRLFLADSQQLSIRSDLENLKSFFPISKSCLIDKLDQEVSSVASRLELLENAERKRETRKDIGISILNPTATNAEQTQSCKKDVQDLKREINDVKVQFRIVGQALTTLSQQVDRYSNVENDLKELLVKLEARLGVKTLAAKLVDVEEHVSQYSEYFEGYDLRINKMARQCEQATNKVCQIQARLEQQPKHTECEITYQQFQETIETLQTQQDNKLMKVITEYNDNFLTIDQSICDMKDFIQQVMMINKTITQKLQSVWRNQLNGREQLEELYKTSDDVYTLLETNIQRICQLSKKEMSFEHEVKELKEKIEVVDSSGTRRRIGSFNASFSDMKSSKLMTDIKENMLPPTNRRSGIFNVRPPATSLMDENIQDQSGSFG